MTMCLSELYVTSLLLNITEPRSLIDQLCIASMYITFLPTHTFQCAVQRQLSVWTSLSDGIVWLQLFDHCYSEEVFCLSFLPPFRSEAPRNHSMTPFSMVAWVALAVSGFFVTASGNQNKIMFDNIKLVILVNNTFKVNSHWYIPLLFQTYYIYWIIMNSTAVILHKRLSKSLNWNYWDWSYPFFSTLQCTVVPLL